MEVLLIIFGISISALVMNLVIYYAVGFFPYIAKVIVRTLVIDSVIRGFEFLVSFLLYGSGANFESYKIFYYVMVVIEYLLLLIVNGYAAYLLYKDYKRRKQLSNNNIDTKKKDSDNIYEWIIFIVGFIFIVITSKNVMFPNYATDLIVEKLPSQSLIYSIVFSIILCFMWLIAVKRLKTRKITYPILYLVMTITVTMILGIFIEFDVVQLIYVYLLIFSVAVAIVLFLYFYDKDKNV